MSSRLRSATRVQWFGKNDRSSKAVWREAVYAHLERAYSSIGGIRLGSGFKDAWDMQRSIPVWRLVFEEERLVSVMVFKQKKEGLKMVAYAAGEASEEVREKDIGCMVRHSYAELSGALLIAVLRQLGPSVGRHLLAPDRVLGGREILPLEESGAGVLQSSENGRLLAKLRVEFPEVVPYLYVRKIGGRLKLKLLVGSLSQGKALAGASLLCTGYRLEWWLRPHAA